MNMTTPLYDIWRIEHHALITKRSAKWLLGLGLVVGIAAPLLMLKLQDLIDSRAIDALIGENVAMSLMRSLTVYNVVIAPPMIAIISAQSLAGDWRDKQLQTTLTAPISRWNLLSAKTMAICSVSALSMTLMALPVFIISFSQYQVLGPLGNATVAIGLSLLSHAFITGLSFTLAMKTQRVWLCATLTMALLFFFFVVHVILKAPALLLPESMKELGPNIATWLPWDWMLAWSGWKSGFGYAPTRLSLGLLILFTALRFQFEKSDIS